jgi:hypothetical protein
VQFSAISGRMINQQQSLYFGGDSIAATVIKNNNKRWRSHENLLASIGKSKSINFNRFLALFSSKTFSLLFLLHLTSWLIKYNRV